MLRTWINSMSIRSRAVITVMVAITCGLSSVLISLRFAYMSTLESEALNAVFHAEKALEVVEAEDAAMLAAVAEAIETRPDIREALASGSAKRLDEVSRELFESLRDQHGITHLYFISPGGRVILRVHKPDQFGDLLERATFAEAKRTGRPASGLEIGKTAFALRHVRPVFVGAASLEDPTAIDGKPVLVGYLEVAQEIEQYLEIIQGHTGDEYALILRKDHLDEAAWIEMRGHRGQRNDWDDHEEYVVATASGESIAAREWALDALDEVDEGTLGLVSVTEADDRVTAIGTFGIADAFGQRSGIMLVRHDLTAVASRIRAIQSGVSISAMSTAVVLSVLIIVLLNVLIFRRLERMKITMAETVARLGSPAPVAHASPTKKVDEITSFEDQLDFYREHLEEIVESNTADLRRSNEELQCANEAKSRMLANMSHELRTPLNSIIGYTGVVLQGLAGPLTGEQSKQLGFVSRSGKQLLALIEDILDLSRIEAGRVTLRASDFTVDEIVDDVLADTARQAEVKGLELMVGDRLVGVDMKTDRGRLAQVLRNLVDNAIKYTPVGRVTVTADAVGADHVRFSVTDTGVGIRTEQQEWVFRAFTQTEEAAAHRVGGTGLGLSICRLIVRALGGNLCVSSVLGEGSTFSFVVPRTLATDGSVDVSAVTLTPCRRRAMERDLRASDAVDHGDRDDGEAA